MKFESADYAAEKALRDPEYLHPLIKEAAVEARKLKKKEAIDPKLFVDVYGEEAVARDLEYVRKMKELFSKEDQVQKQWADVFEAVFYKHADQSNWLGEDVHTILTSEFDDIVNKIDVIVRMNEESRAFPYLGMAIDVTFGSTSVAKKIAKIFSEIDNEKEGEQLGKIRYFMDPEYDNRFKGQLSQIAHVVVGVERSHMIELARQWMDSENKVPGANKALAANPIQLVVLKQIMEQLVVYRDYARKKGKENLAQIYEADISFFEPILRERRKMDIRDYENDHVAAALSAELSARK